VLASRRRGTDPVAPRTPDVEWSDVMQAVFLHRVHGLLAPHVAQLGVPERFADRLGAAQRRMLDNGIAVTCDTAEVSDLLDTAGIEHLIVKGVVLAAVVGDLPALRGGGDIDLWVRPGEAAEVELLARANGWHRRPIASRLPQPADTWRWRTLMRFAHEQPLDHPDRATLDLHWRLAEHQDELGFDFDHAYRRSIAVPAIGPSARTLCLEDAFVHIAQHGRKEAWSTLRHLLDVVRLVEACGRDTTRQLVRNHRNVALAVLTASHIDPSLHELADAADRHTRALADEAWRGCLSLEFPRQIRRAITGRDALHSRLLYESWLARSAPTWATRRVWALHLAVPLRPLIEPAPSRVHAEPVERSSR
jgi:hypothetical protein